ncbi:MAG: 30S ribosomal protein S16 [Actinomycetota bacterium]|nr:30S ribosomal protein S16 [Actinomycetota bacterium]
MAVKIRLKRMGKIRTPFYRIVVADSRTKRDGRVIEEIGTYNPKADPSVITVVSDRAQYWLGVGAQPTEAVTALLKLTGDWETFSGEKQTRTLEVAAPKRDKAEIFDEALKDLHAGESKSDATTKKAAAKKADKKAEEPKAEKKAEEKPAEAAKAEEPKADKKAEEKPAEEPKAEESATEEAPAAEAPAAEASEEAKA